MYRVCRAPRPRARGEATGHERPCIGRRTDPGRSEPSGPGEQPIDAKRVPALLRQSGTAFRTRGTFFEDESLETRNGCRTWNAHLDDLDARRRSRRRGHVERVRLGKSRLEFSPRFADEREPIVRSMIIHVRLPSLNPRGRPSDLFRSTRRPPEAPKSAEFLRVCEPCPNTEQESFRSGVGLPVRWIRELERLGNDKADVHHRQLDRPPLPSRQAESCTCDAGSPLAVREI